MSGDSLVLTEKPSQRRNVIAAVGNQFGPVIALQGHILRLAEPDEVNPDWKSWGYDVLLPQSGLYPSKPDKSKTSLLKDVLGALKKAKTVYLATDSDREGQLIGEEILAYSGFSGRVMRVMFNAEDPATLQAAFSQAQPNSTYVRLRDAAIARQQSDQIYNLSLTRGATVSFKAEGAKGAIGVGRVMTATLAIVCRRQIERDQFQPIAFFTISATCSVDGKQFKMWRRGDRITSEPAAQTIAKLVEGWTGPLSVKKQTKREAPPSLFDIAGLIEAASKEWDWPAGKTTDIAQAVYQEQKLITYIGSDAKFLPEGQIQDAPILLDGLSKLPGFANVPSAPTIRTGKGGHFWDKGLEGFPHHAIVPNLNVLSNADQVVKAYNSLNEDEQQLFRMVARRYIAAVSPDYVFEETVIEASIQLASETHCFQARGSVPIELGWRAILDEPTAQKRAAKKSSSEEDDEANEAGDGQKLPSINPGAEGTITDPKVGANTTKPPPLFTEGTLIKAMKEAWRYVSDPNVQERLKEARGIGTARTQPEVLKRLKTRGQLTSKGRHIVPTDDGMRLYNILCELSPRVVDPGATAVLENRLDDVLLGKATAQAVIHDVAKEVGATLDSFRQCAGRISLNAGGKQKSSRSSTVNADPLPNLDKICPTCGVGNLRYIKSSKSGALFIGCSKYPDCKHVEFDNEPNQADKLYLIVPFADKDLVKRHGAKWDNTKRQWYVYSNETDSIRKLSQWRQ